MKILMTSPHPATKGPIYGLMMQLISALVTDQNEVVISYQGSQDNKRTYAKRLITLLDDYYNFFILIVKTNPDVVFINSAHDWRAVMRDLILILFSILVNKKYTLLYHSSKGKKHNYKNFIYKFLFGYGVKHALGVFTLSEEERAAIQEIWKVTNTLLIRLPFNKCFPYEESYFEKAKPTSLIFIGRLIHSKGILQLLHAIKNVVMYAPVHLKIIGDGPLLQDCYDLINKLEIDNYVELLGYLPSEIIWDHLIKSRILILPTQTEGFPVVVLEAMAAGLSIVSTKVGGLPDFLEEGTNILFTDPNDPQIIANNIIDLVRNDGLQRKMHYANLEKIKEFSPIFLEKTIITAIQLWSCGSRLTYRGKNEKGTSCSI